MELTEKAINKMKHALGCDFLDPKDGRQMYRRNFYGSRTPVDTWEQLVEAGYATKREQFGEIVYSVTDKGITQLGKTLGVRFRRD